MPRILKIPNIDDLIKRYQSGVSLNQIAKDTGIVRITLWRHFVKKGVQMRGQSDSEALKWQTRRCPSMIQRQLSAAWAARSGAKDPLARRIKRAITREARGTHVFLHETEILRRLRSRGYCFVPQKAIGPYNVDLAMNESRVAVEIIGSQMNRSRRSKYPERLEYILDQGWFVLLVSLRSALDVEYEPICNEIIRWADLAGSNKSLRGQYGVIGRNAKPLARSSDYVEGRTNVFGTKTSNEMPPDKRPG